ncbi:hypothetical protein GCM10010977_29200 [Citricoccus zhacaiensis]|uniref:Uncharacterized protein n=1 Tax=Citricoccus zhacaiensis TaxID=489142 RepID=A0ABQ2MAB0_9MICC|nr:hypothetical protein GCM10010977_29200 [Citricoccus zhacaiensis]
MGIGLFDSIVQASRVLERGSVDRGLADSIASSTGNAGMTSTLSNRVPGEGEVPL